MKVDARMASRPREGEVCEVWLRGNPRPMIAVAVIACAAAAALACAGLAIPLPWLTAVAVFVGAVVVSASLVLAAAAALPRIERRGRDLRLRVGPTRAYDLPIELVECFFHGAHAIGRPVEPCTGEASEHDEHDESSGRRRTTLVVRIAERASDWQERPTFRPWAGWKRGSVVLDGLWYEPLPMEGFAALAERLVQAKRSISRREGTA
jgi:hypothetical protein